MERELSREIEKRCNKAPDGFWVPREVLCSNMERSYIAGTGTLGGMLVQTANLGQEFIEILRNDLCMSLQTRNSHIASIVGKFREDIWSLSRSEASQVIDKFKQWKEERK